jgi:ectoine hydroxylase-related dioxygenase (phytanoyl-CoA dioxygenase family)
VSGATELRLFHDHVLIKTGDAPETPWHQDRPYYLVDGPISFSVWITPDQVPLSESLAFIRGSHALGREFAPVNFNNGEIIDQDNNNFEHLNIKEIEELAQLGVLTFSLSPGDGLMFDNRIIHKAMRGNDEANRRALSIRFVGDGAFMTARVINPTPPFHRMGLRIQEGKPVTDVWFPRVELI